ncbi:nuclear transport factor 2 family protein [Haladaptatus sp. DFWS20]|uniref:nuclear transport factor 2 family protein n=1 Tax=Haladaptatus sp. DFWS20 TaxID=3403467 RepID=UPI003EBE6A4F
MSKKVRLDRIVSHLELREIRAKYCYAIDERDWNEFRTLFTDDPVLDFGAMGVYKGRDGLDRFINEFVENQLLGSAHLLANPLIEIDGDEATGAWYVNSPITFTDGTGAWRLGRYDDEYRRIDGRWRIDHIQLRFIYTADYDGETWSDLCLVSKS